MFNSLENKKIWPSRGKLNTVVKWQRKNSKYWSQPCI